jgi:seryl-tRNA synthetase
MLQVQKIRENIDFVKERLSVKHFTQLSLIDELLQVDELRKSTQKGLDDLLSESNQLSKKVADFFKQGNKEDAEKAKEQSASLKDKTGSMQETLRELETKLEEILVKIPNLPHTLVPKGKLPEDNEVVRSHGKFPKLDASAIAHWEIADKYRLFDLELGVKITGAGFPVYSGKGAKLQRALISFFLDEAIDAGYKEFIPPLMVNRDSAFATGQIPDKEGQMYFTQDEFYLIPTAEVPLTNIYRNVILQESDFPVKMCGYTPCFRREAGSYGKDVRGLNRLHQFDKIEIVQITQQEHSYEALEHMLSYVEGLLKKLELPYRVLRLCGGDMTFSSAMTYDLEVYSAAQKRWLEVSSVSNFETYQANRLKVRYKNKEGKMQLAHTLNGSALALPRIVAAMLENHQTTDGIRIPDSLRPYTKFDFIC